VEEYSQQRRTKHDHRERVSEFVAQHNKGYCISGNIKNIHQYLTREIEELLVYLCKLVCCFGKKKVSNDKKYYISPIPMGRF
jgi:hypothetical protein